MRDLHGNERLRLRYIDALVLGERDLARVVVSDCRKQGLSVATIYLDILAPAQVRIGDLWHEGNVNVAREHLATSITLDMMDLLMANIEVLVAIGFRAIVTSVEGDTHIVGARMVADLLTMDGWNVDFLGSSTPAKDLVEFVRYRPADVVALSATLGEFLPNAKTAAEGLHALDPCPKVLLGGLAILVTGFDVQSLGCDAIGYDALEALREARRLVGLTEQELTLENRLIGMGQKIKSVRMAHRITQQQLSNESGLARTYISMVEQGKQNLTIGAMLKIAEALGVPIVELIADATRPH